MHERGMGHPYHTKKRRSQTTHIHIVLLRCVVVLYEAVSQTDGRHADIRLPMGMRSMPLTEPIPKTHLQNNLRTAYHGMDVLSRLWFRRLSCSGQTKQHPHRMVFLMQQQFNFLSGERYKPRNHHACQSVCVNP